MLVIAVVLIILAVIIGGFLLTAGIVSGLNGKDWLTEEEKAERKKREELNKNNHQDFICADSLGINLDLDTMDPLNVLWSNND